MDSLLVQFIPFIPFSQHFWKILTVIKYSHLKHNLPLIYFIKKILRCWVWWNDFMRSGTSLIEHTVFAFNLKIHGFTGTCSNVTPSLQQRVKWLLFNCSLISSTCLHKFLKQAICILLRQYHFKTGFKLTKLNLSVATCFKILDSFFWFFLNKYF